MQDPNIVRAIHHTQCFTVLVVLILWCFFILQLPSLASASEKESLSNLSIYAVFDATHSLYWNAYLGGLYSKRVESNK